MTCIYSLRTLFIITMLLVSQVGSAFIPESATKECSMDMSSHVELSTLSGDMEATIEHSEIDSVEPEKKHKSTVSSASSKNMECCDFDVPSKCCDSQCQCSSFTSSTSLVNTKLFFVHHYQSQDLNLHRLRSLHPPFLQHPKRPPKAKFS